MTCLDESQIRLLLEGELPHDARGEVEAHLDTCEACRRVIGAAAPTEGARAHGAAALDRGASIGRYLVLSLLGRGGMGMVYAAYDPELDRRVALKLLQTARGSEGARKLLLREARALGKLSHPNVVQVHDVGEHGGDVFVAMELVEGQPLDVWCRSTPKPSFPEVLAAYLDAARGLSAAHEKGLVHRDVKPSNILRGDDGRVRVADFGLAAIREAAPRDGVMPASAVFDERLTATGAVLGTPRYMAPEQHEGARATARSDQYGFCVALHEGLYGATPFPPASRVELLAVKKAGPPASPPAGSRVPAWIYAALARGLAPAPEDRHPSMDALIAALRDDLDARRRSRWRKAGIGAIAAGLVALAAGGWARSGAFRDPCAHPEQQLAGVWDADVKGRVRAAFLGTGRVYAEDTAARVLARLDAYGAGWAAMRGEVCAASRGARGPREGLALRDACLDRRRGQLQALTALLTERPDSEVLDKAVQMAAELSPVAYCADTEALLARVRPPEDPAVRARVAALEPQVDRVEALFKGGKFKDGLALGEPLLAEVAAIPYAPLRAHLQHTVGRLREEDGNLDGAEALLREAAVSAAEGRDDLTVSAAWADLLFIVARQQRFDEGAVIRALGPTVVMRAHDDRMEAKWSNAVGTLLRNMGKYAEAKVALEHALALREKALGPDHPDTASSLHNVGIVLCVMGDCAAARARFERAVAISERSMGPDHPDTAMSLGALGNALRRVGDYPAALATQRRTLAIMEKSLGPDHPNIASVLTNLGNVFNDTGDYPGAVAHYERAVAIREKSLGPEHPSVAVSLNNLGGVLYAMGDQARASATLERAIAIKEKVLGPEHPEVAATLVNLGRTMVQRGQLDAARSALERARTLMEKKLGPAHPELAGALLGLGELHLARSAAAEAVPLLERALALDSAERKGETQLALAEALWQRGQDRPRARTLAEEARAAYARLGHRPGLDRAARWLADHPL